MYFNPILIALILAATPLAVADGGYIDSCEAGTVTLAGTILSANCRTQAGGLERSSVDLGPCVGDVNGYLQCAEGGYQETFQTCQLYESQSLECLIPGGGGAWTVLFDLNTCVGNQDGQLHC